MLLRKNARSIGTSHVCGHQAALQAWQYHDRINDPWNPSPPAPGCHWLDTQPQRTSSIRFEIAETYPNVQAFVQQTREAYQLHMKII
jgi:hypothetical protein